MILKTNNLKIIKYYSYIFFLSYIFFSSNYKKFIKNNKFLIFLLFIVNKQKWVPLEIDITKNRSKRDRSPKYHNQREKNGEGI